MYFYCISLILMGVVNLACTGPDSPTKWPNSAWDVTSATSQGMNYDSLALFSAELKSGDLGYIDGMLIILNRVNTITMILTGIPFIIKPVSIPCSP